MERTSELHKEYLDLIEAGGQRHTVTYGINNRSPLIDLVGFDITSCLPFDIMHTIFEGVATLHLQALHYYLVDTKKSITLVQLNTILRTHKYHSSETKPSPISKDNDGTYHIKQTGMNIKIVKFYLTYIASQMMTLVRLLLFLVGDYIEYDNHWECYLLLLSVCDMCCAFEVQPDDPAKLSWLVQTYLELFASLYSSTYSITPKMHYMTHFPQQMIM